MRQLRLGTLKLLRLETLRLLRPNILYLSHHGSEGVSQGILYGTLLRGLRIGESVMLRREGSPHRSKGGVEFTTDGKDRINDGSGGSAEEKGGTMRRRRAVSE